MALTQYPWLEEAAARLDAMRERLPNAILIHGMPGVGTLELARWFAERLLCESPKADGSPCGKCPGCRMMHANGHPDCRIVVSEFLANALDLPYTPPETSSSSKKLSREIRIHQFRALTDFLTMAPSRGGRRCVLVYPADMVRAEAAASLLKSMEEPPEGCVFILAADDIDAVLPTIRSRSRLLRVGVPSKEDALAWLSSQKRLKGDPEVALAMAGGAPLNAVKDITGLTLDAKASATLRDLLARGRSLTPDSSVRGYSASMGIPAVALHLSRWCYDLLRVKSGADPHFFIREKDVLEKIAADATMKNLLSLNAAVAEMRRSADRAAHQAIEPLGAMEYMAYARRGDDVYETNYYKRRNRLCGLILGECALHDGRYMDDIVSLIWSILEESSWVLPQNNRARYAMKPVALPLAVSPDVDRASARSGSWRTTPRKSPRASATRSTGGCLSRCSARSGWSWAERARRKWPASSAGAWPRP